MPITINDVGDLINLLRDNPDLQVQLARHLLSREVLLRVLQADPETLQTLREILVGDSLRELFAIVQELTESSRQSVARLNALEQVVAELVESSRQSVARLDRQEAELEALKESSRQSVARLNALEQVVAELVESSRQSVARLDRQEAELEALKESSRQSVARLNALEQVVAELVESSRQSVARLNALEQVVAELVESSRQSVARLDRQEAELIDLRRTVVDLVEISRQSLERLDRLEQGVESLQSWQRGEDGRRKGERYQREVRRQAWQLLAGGAGGYPEEAHVEQRLRLWLPPSPEDDFPEDGNNPVLADLIWWKGDRVAVIEVSFKVNGSDIRRARARCEALQRVGVDAIPMVIGSEWAHPDSRRIAEAEQVEWKVGNDLSDGFIQFRKLASYE
ncbi:MAG: hypothetical protein KatS3mg020_0683 [Fimbriimonadales bacterium]|nr:MAG: hypothetical protein KatS3mg020_0683 [Fimbriimonadales bacterium]